jgi:hypothetical protein
MFAGASRLTDATKSLSDVPPSVQSNQSTTQVLLGADELFDVEPAVKPGCNHGAITLPEDYFGR